MINKRLLLIILILVSNFTFGQNTVESLFKNADELYENGDLDSALTIYSIITDKFGNDPAYPRAFYNVGYVSYELKKYDIAEKVFLKILNSNFNDKDKGPGEGIMSEPYALYKHRACAILSEIYLDKKDFKNALKYLKLADKKYPYEHFCGNEYASNEIYTAVAYSKCYNGLNQIDKAINVLWPYIFYYGLASNKAAIEQMKEVLLKKYTSEQIEQELQNAEKTILIKKKKDTEIGSINILKNKILLPDDFALWQIGTTIKFEDYLKVDGIQKYKLLYKTSDFYRTFIN